MSLYEDNRLWPRKCTRCGKSISDIEHYHVNHGWEEYCDDCENSFNKWMLRGKKKTIQITRKEFVEGLGDLLDEQGYLGYIEDEENKK